jgi:hypothetical protein
MIRQAVTAVPGREAEAEEVFSLIERRTEIIDTSIEPDISALARGLLLRPSIRRLIGMSGGIVPSRIPRWMTFPVLRLANIVKLGTACQLKGIASTKLEFGGAKLAGPAFAAASAREWADSMASFVLSSRFDTDIGAFVINDPTVLRGIVNFRRSQEGVNLRKEILDQLSVSAASDIVTSINAGLKRTIPPNILQGAHDRLASLMISKNPESKITPALWNNTVYDDKALSLWKKQSARILANFCETNRITNYDLCPCDSGEKLRFCCGESLKVTLGH